MPGLFAARRSWDEPFLDGAAGFRLHAPAMNALSNVQPLMPVFGMVALLLAKRPAIQLKWRVAMIRAAFGQEGFR